MNEASRIREAIESAKTIAVVGCSPNPARPSNSISRYLQESGYRVVPVNPGHRELLGEPCYPSIEAIPPGVRIDIVDVFRRSSEVGPIADQAIRRGAGFFFMQQGVVDRAAAERLEAAGIPVAMDRCILVERERLARVRS
ncbi:MAG: CoA-binding protein [Acidobacteriota bacterium]|nr:CoA-binding protein [Acidobacteriota bacterium]